MTTQQMILRSKPTSNQPVLYMAIAFSNQPWQVVFSDGRKQQVIVKVGDVAEPEWAVKSQPGAVG